VRSRRVAMKYSTGTAMRDRSSDATSPAISEIARPWKIGSNRITPAPTGRRGADHTSVGGRDLGGQIVIDHLASHRRKLEADPCGRDVGPCSPIEERLLGDHRRVKVIHRLRVGALALGRLLTALLYGLAPTDAATLAVALVALGLIVAAASYLPARGAARVDPLTALRQD